MNFYQLTMGPNVNQASLLQALQKLGGETIQTASGLFSALPASEAEVRKAAESAAAAEGVEISAVDAGGDLSGLSKDAQSLIEKHRDS